MRILALDIETSPVLAHVWGLWDQNVGLNQIKSDWHVLAWAAKWVGDPPHKTMYMDQRNAKDLTNDLPMLKAIWKLIDEADVILSQNGKRFDIRKLNARFVLNGMKPPSSFKHIDTCEIAKKKFGFTSNKLEYMSDKLCVKYKKLKHKEFAGFELWSECLAGNLKAWKCMEKYNRYDVLALEELYMRLRAWDSTVNFSLYTEDEIDQCSCGSTDFKKNGFAYTSLSKFQRYCCTECGTEIRGRTNLLSKEKMKSLKVGIK